MGHRAVNWDGVIEALKGAVRAVCDPWIGGHLRPGSDLDVIVILRRQEGEVSEFARVLASIYEALAARPDRFLIFHRFSQFPSRPTDIEDAHLAPVHLMLYPDAAAAVGWERHWILQSLLESMTPWHDDRGRVDEVVASLRVEPFAERIATYRRDFHEAIHDFVAGASDPALARARLTQRMRYVVRYALYEMAVSGGALRKGLSVRDTLRREIPSQSDAGLLAIDAALVDLSLEAFEPPFWAAIDAALRDLERRFRRTNAHSD